MGEPDWIEFKIRIPMDEDQKIFKVLRKMGFAEVDWCVQEREEDKSRVEYYPAPPHSKRYWEEETVMGGRYEETEMAGE